MYLRRSNRGSGEFLRNIPLFAPCSDRELRRIARIGTEVEVETGRVLTWVGRPGSQFCVIVSGTASVWREGVRLDVLQAGSFFGEVALLDHDMCSATVVADTRMRLIALSRREFLSPHFLTPSVQAQMLKELSRRLRRANMAWARGQRGQAVAPTFEAPAIAHES
jgi:CRP-like cAMP-binding protein